MFRKGEPKELCVRSTVSPPSKNGNALPADKHWEQPNLVRQINYSTPTAIG